MTCAAPLRWWAFDGPDAVDNGLCLCSFHHKLLDRGVLDIIVPLRGDQRVELVQYLPSK